MNQGSEGVWQVACIVQAEDVPVTINLLKNGNAARAQVDVPNLVQIEIEKCASQDLVDDLVADQNNGFVGMAVDQFRNQLQETRLDLDQTLTIWEPDLTWGSAPQSV